MVGTRIARRKSQVITFELIDSEFPRFYRRRVAGEGPPPYVPLLLVPADEGAFFAF